MRLFLPQTTTNKITTGSHKPCLRITLPCIDGLFAGMKIQFPLNPQAIATGTAVLFPCTEAQFFCKEAPLLCTEARFLCAAIPFPRTAISFQWAEALLLRTEAYFSCTEGETARTEGAFPLIFNSFRFRESKTTPGVTRPEKAAVSLLKREVKAT